MQLNEAGAKLIQYYEKCILTAYPDPASALAQRCRHDGFALPDYKFVTDWAEWDGKPWTIGWGHTPANPGQVITQAKADIIFDADTMLIGDEVLKVLDGLGFDPNENEYAALVSFAYNLGIKPLKDIIRVMDFPKCNMQAFANTFLQYNHAKGVVLAGLTRRRNAEKALFLLKPVT